MFILRSAVRNLLRNLSRTVVICFALCALFFFAISYSESIMASEEQYAELPAVVPVQAMVVNLNGAQNVGLEIPLPTVEQLLASSHVAAPIYTATYFVDFGEVPSNTEKIERDAYLIGTNDLPNYLGIAEDAFQFMPGYGVEAFTAGEPVFVADSAYIESLGLSPGDDVPITLYTQAFDDYDISFSFARLGVASLKLVGSFDSSAAVSDAVRNSRPVMIAPAGWMRGHFLENGLPFAADSFRFRVENPLLLNAFKAEMEATGFQPVDYMAPFSRQGAALSVQDKLFIDVAQELKANITFQRSFYPALLAVAAFAGYIIAYLQVQSRSAEVATMRSLGCSPYRCAALFGLENALICLAGFALSMVPVYFISAHLRSTATGLLMFIIFIGGTVVAITLQLRSSIMKAMATAQ